MQRQGEVENGGAVFWRGWARLGRVTQGHSIERTRYGNAKTEKCCSGIDKLRNAGSVLAGTGAATRRYGTALRSDAKLRQRYDSTDTQSEGIAQFGGAGQRQSSEWICNGEGEVELSLAW